MTDQLLGHSREVSSESLRLGWIDVLGHEHDEAVRSLRESAEVGGLDLAEPEAEVTVSILGVDAPGWTYAWRPETAQRVREEVLRRVEQIEHPPTYLDPVTGRIERGELHTARISLRVTAVGTPTD